MKGDTAWLLQRVTGIFLFAGVLFHFFFMHFTGERQITYEIVIRRLSSPSWKIFDSLFLASAIYHGFNGIWGLSLEYLRNEKVRGITQVIILVSAVLLLFTGVYIISL